VTFHVIEFGENNNPPSSPLTLRGDKRGVIPTLAKGRSGGILKISSYNIFPLP